MTKKLETVTLISTTRLSPTGEGYIFSVDVVRDEDSTLNPTTLAFNAKLAIRYEKGVSNRDNASHPIKYTTKQKRRNNNSNYHFPILPDLSFSRAFKETGKKSLDSNHAKS